MGQKSRLKKFARNAINQKDINIAYFIIAIANTVILFIPLCLIGGYILCEAMSSIPF